MQPTKSFLTSSWILLLLGLLLTACSDGNHLSAEEISKMSEEQIKAITPEQIGKMSPGELRVMDERRSYFSDERTKAGLKRIHDDLYKERGANQGHHP